MSPLISSILPVLKRGKSKVGLPPGSVVFVGEETSRPVSVTVTDFDADTLRERAVDDVSEVVALRDSPSISWINVDGLHDTELIQQIGEHFGIHPLVQEDIVHTAQRPKFEDHDDYLFLTIKMIYEEEHTKTLRTEHVSLIVGRTYVISFQEEVDDIFGHVRARIRDGRGRIRTFGADYLAYALLDVIVDHYFVVLERFSETAEFVENQVLEGDTADVQGSINDLRRNLIRMRRTVWPVREMLSQLERSESPLIHDATRPFIRDAYDHAVQVVDVAESLRDLVSGLTDLYMTAISNRMNEIMKVLTIIGTIFIPLTFIAGIYGMNFSYMPELTWRYGYFGTLSVMLIIVGLLVLYFRRRRWI